MFPEKELSQEPSAGPVFHKTYYVLKTQSLLSADPTAEAVILPALAQVVVPDLPQSWVAGSFWSPHSMGWTAAGQGCLLNSLDRSALAPLWLLQFKHKIFALVKLQPLDCR